MQKALGVKNKLLNAPVKDRNSFNGILRFFYASERLHKLPGAGVILFILFMISAIACAEEMDLTRAVIHHSASPDVSAKTIDKWHKERGWSGIGYHFVIRVDGKIEKGRPLSKKGAHAKGRNHYIGICLTGYDTFTPTQTKSLVFLLNNLGVKEIFPHHEKCPGKGLNLQYVKNSIHLKATLFARKR
ncbi:MAG: N-acetylmuramoyl-L-alanine amidase [Candidatus Omnitrophica bacterium]|nr:N-acetylmuramoyl-L-alanine amidase [Candidatus Omnitrophota bacterium]MDD5592683.1 N-acetylmuramoyl-L-alanine amidase [Candidatus Omnitrophota bacterium]